MVSHVAYRNTVIGAARFCLENFSNSRLNNYIVTEFPKSGGTWACQLISEVLGLRFHRNALPGLRNQVLHSHRTKYLSEDNTITMVRDGRDVYISYFYHSLFENDLYNHEHVRRVRNKFCGSREVNIETDLADFISFVHNDNLHYNGNWSRFLKRRLQRNPRLVYYENLLNSGKDEIKRVLRELGVSDVEDHIIDAAISKYSFNTQSSGSSSGSTGSHRWLRSGTSGQWRSVYNDDARSAFNKHNFSMLNALGYEDNEYWKIRA